jgi:hypothetical protein
MRVGLSGPDPDTSAAFTVAPEVEYSPILPAVLFVTKICAPCAVGGTSVNIADTANASMDRTPNFSPRMCCPFAVH